MGKSVVIAASLCCLLAPGLLPTAVFAGTEGSPTAMLVTSADDQPRLTPLRQAALRAVFDTCPGAKALVEGAELTRLYGATFATGSSPEDSAEKFRLAHSAVWGASPEDLLPLTPILESGHTLPLRYDPGTGRSRFTLVYYSQYRDGIPVFRADLRLLVRNEPGFPLVWAGSSLRELADFTVPPGAAGAAFDPTTVAPELVNFTVPQTVIWAGSVEMPDSPVLAVTFEGDNYGAVPARRPEKWLFVVELATGRVLLKENRIHMVDVVGSVTGAATTGPKAEHCAAEVPTPLPYAKITSGSTTVYADANGNYVLPNAGSTPIQVSSPMSGRYFTVQNLAGGGTEDLTQTVTPPGPADFLHNQANTSAAVRAQVNAYVQANHVRDMVIAANPSYPTIGTQLNFPLKVNSDDYWDCPGNAWYDGNSLTFCAGGSFAGYTFPNMAFSVVVHHEYGHHIVEKGGSGQGQYGEGAADSMGVLLTDDPTLGYGADGTGSCALGMRTANNTFQYPCNGDPSGHDCGQLLSGCIWSIRNQLRATYPDPATYLGILSSLLINSVPMHAGERISPQICTDFLTLDDDDADLSNGTPHSAQLLAGFAAHNMLPQAAPDNDACAGAILVCPGESITGSTLYASNDGTANCDSVPNAGAEVWYKYRPAASGSATFSLCTGTNYDTVMSLHSGCPGTSSNQVVCNDDGCGGVSRSSQITRNVTAKTTYLIRVAGFNGDVGSHTLTITGPDCAVPDESPPSPNPMTFGGSPLVLGSSSVRLTASLATDAASPPVEYLFAWTAPGLPAADSGWTSARIYTAAGLMPNTTYTFRTKARDSETPPNETGLSEPATATTLIDTPGLAFGTVTPTSIELIAAGNMANLEVGDSGVLFECLTAAAVSGIGDWIRQTSAVASGLTPDTEYMFQVKARNRVGIESAGGMGVSMRTLAQVPGAGTLTVPQAETLRLAIDANGNPPSTLYAIQCTATEPSDPLWNDKFVGSTGLPADEPAWRNSGAWGSGFIRGVKTGTLYTFRVKARNQVGVETEFGPPSIPPGGGPGVLPVNACGTGCGAGAAAALPMALVWFGWRGWLRRSNQRRIR